MASSSLLYCIKDDDRQHAQSVLPLTSDLFKLKESLKESIPECCKAVNECPTRQSYISPKDVALTSIIQFNKQRSAEAFRVLVNS